MNDQETGASIEVTTGSQLITDGAQTFAGVKTFEDSIIIDGEDLIESGTFTPTFAATSGSATIIGSNASTYVRVGRIVQINMQIE